jgi:hypothetical protein
MKKYRLRPPTVEAIQFDPKNKPWPSVLMPWPDERGRTPRDMSFGYVDSPGANERLHVKSGDYIVIRLDVNKHGTVIEVMSPDKFLAIFDEDAT